MAFDKEKYVKRFIDESLENIKLVESLVFNIKEGVSIEDDLANLLRSLHTLKGTSRMLDFKRIGDLSHALESVFIAYREHRIDFSKNAINLVFSSLDLLKSGLNVIQKEKDDNIDIPEYVKNLTLLAANEKFVIPKKEAADKDAKRNVKTDSIRLSLDKIDGIIKSIASLHSIETSAKSISHECTLLNAQIKEYIKQEPSTGIILKKLQRLGERLNTSIKNYAIDTGNSIRSAYDSVISLRTLPLSTVFDSYPRYVYDLSQELGKKVRLTIEGKENEIDKNIIESLSEVVMHMVRNAIDHGLETPQERLDAGKDETGRLSIVCSRESGSIKIVINDDGRGINLEKIRGKIVKEGLYSENDASLLSNEELMNYIFQSGFSTSTSVSDISGRGVGMDVVRENVESLKGSIVVDSEEGAGTAFTIIVPLSIAALSGFPVECGIMKFIIPANFVENIILFNASDSQEINYNDRVVKLYYLDNILKINNEREIPADRLFVFIIRSYEDIAGIVVDNIESMGSFILKPMPSFMEKMTVFSGIVLNEDYEMAGVLHIPTVIKIAKNTKPADMKKHNIKTEKQRKTILVVDDSMPTREIERDILSSEGYNVDTANDGQQALQAVEAKHYDLICTDLNMPVMDGFTFIENIKKNNLRSDIPIIVISSIANEKEQKRAFELGASRYIVKNSFNNYNLLEAARELTAMTKGETN